MDSILEDIKEVLGVKYSSSITFIFFKALLREIYSEVFTDFMI